MDPFELFVFDEREKPHRKHDDCYFLRMYICVSVYVYMLMHPYIDMCMHMYMCMYCIHTHPKKKTIGSSNCDAPQYIYMCIKSRS